MDFNYSIFLDIVNWIRYNSTMKITKKARKELKELIRKTLDDVYGFPKTTSERKTKFIDLCGERVANYFDTDKQKGATNE